MHEPQGLHPNCQRDNSNYLVYYHFATGLAYTMAEKGPVLIKQKPSKTKQINLWSKVFNKENKIKRKKTIWCRAITKATTN